MALELLQAGLQPLGQYDGYDSIALTILGGEVGTLVGVALGSDSAAWDASGVDGYVNGTRPAVTTTLTSGVRPLFLLDEGIAGYGTLFGSVLGGTAGQATGGAVLGPHTATGSGKITCWDKPGTYAVTLDAVDTDAADGLVPTNVGLTVGAALYATPTGLLTPDGASSFEASLVVARFINFETYKGGSLVNTPVFLVSALNSPVGNVPAQLQMARAVIFFNPPVG